MANTLPTDANNTLYEGLRDTSGQQFVAKQAGSVTTDAGGVKSAPTAVAVLSTPVGQTTSAASQPVVVANDQSTLPVQPVRFEIAGQGTGVVNGSNTDFIPSTDVSNYRWFSLQVGGTFNLTLTFQGSNDNSTWVSVPVQPVGTVLLTAAALVTTTTTTGIFAGPINFRYLRVRATSYSSNASLAGNLELWTFAPEPLPGPTQIVPNTTGGTSDYHLISANTTNAQSIKASAGQVYGYDFGNNGAADAYVKLYNKASAPTVGTDTPYRTIYVPKGARVSYHSVVGMALGTGIAIAITGAMADSDTTAVAANQVSIAVEYK